MQQEYVRSSPPPLQEMPHGRVIAPDAADKSPILQSPEIKITQNEKELVCRAGHWRSRTYDQL